MPSSNPTRVRYVGWCDGCEEEKTPTFPATRERIRSDDGVRVRCASCDSIVYCSKAVPEDVESDRLIADGGIEDDSTFQVRVTYLVGSAVTMGFASLLVVAMIAARGDLAHAAHTAELLGKAFTAVGILFTLLWLSLIPPVKRGLEKAFRALGVGR